MADFTKIQIDSEQVLSKEKGMVTFIDTKGTVKKVRATEVEIISKDLVSSPPSTPQSDVPTTDAAQVEPAPQDPSASASATPPPKPARRRSSPKKSEPKASVQAEAPPAPKPEKEMATKPAKKKAAKKAAAAAGTRTIGGKSFDLARYNKQKAPGGGTSYSNGDDVAQQLQGKDLEAIYTIVAKKTKIAEGELLKRFKHLNAGMQRMNLGNMLRKALKG